MRRRERLVLRLPRDHAANVAGRVRDIAETAGYEVDVYVADRLAGCVADVYAHVETIRVVFFYKMTSLTASVAFLLDLLPNLCTPDIQFISHPVGGVILFYVCHVIEDVLSE